MWRLRELTERHRDNTEREREGERVFLIWICINKQHFLAQKERLQPQMIPLSLTSHEKMVLSYDKDVHFCNACV